MINQQLLDFIKGQLAQGKKIEDITKELQTGGWTIKDVEEGFKTINVTTTDSSNISIPPNINTNTITTPQIKNHSGRKIFLIILILFLLAGGVSAYFFRTKLSNLFYKQIPASVVTEIPTTINQEPNLPVQDTNTQLTQKTTLQGNTSSDSNEQINLKTFSSGNIYVNVPNDPIYTSNTAVPPSLTSTSALIVLYKNKPLLLITESLKSEYEKYVTKFNLTDYKLNDNNYSIAGTNANLYVGKTGTSHTGDLFINIPLKFSTVFVESSTSVGISDSEISKIIKSLTL